MNSYGAWLAKAGAAGRVKPVTDLAALRETGVYRIVTPQECLTLARELGTQGRLEFHPLAGGVDPEIGSSGLQLFQAEVAPILRTEGLLSPP